MTPSTILTFLITAGLAFPQTRPAPLPPDASPQAAASPDNLAWNTLREGLRDSDPADRKEDLAAFATLGTNSQAVQLVEQSLKDKDVLVRQEAAAALGEMGSKDAIPFLKAALDDGPEVSFTAARSLWNLGDESDSREIFVEVLEGERKDTPASFILRFERPRRSCGRVTLH